jgi:hypothetical protein
VKAFEYFTNTDNTIRNQKKLLDEKKIPWQNPLCKNKKTTIHLEVTPVELYHQVDPFLGGLGVGSVVHHGFHRSPGEHNSDIKWTSPGPWKAQQRHYWGLSEEKARLAGPWVYQE